MVKSEIFSPFETGDETVRNTNSQHFEQQTHKTQKTREPNLSKRKMFEREPWTWKSYIFSCSNKWCTILLVIMALGQILRLLDLVKVRIPRFTNRGDLNIFGGQTWRAIGFTEWVISYQCWPICACQIKVQGCTTFYGQATEWYWLNEWHWLNYSVVHLCRHSSRMSAAFKHLSEQLLHW